MLKHASPRVVETAPKAQAKTTWWHDVVDHCVDILVLPSSTGGHAHLVLSSSCLSQGMESDSLFHDLFVGVWLMPDLSAVLPIPSLSALPVHRANQVFADVLVLRVSMGCQMGLFWGPSGTKLVQN